MKSKRKRTFIKFIFPQDLRELEEKGQGGFKGGKRKKVNNDNEDTETSSGVRKRIKKNVNDKKGKRQK